MRWAGSNVPPKCKQGECSALSRGPAFVMGLDMPSSIIACRNAVVHTMVISGDTWLTCSHTGRIRRAALSILVATDRHAVAVSSAGQLAVHGCKTQAGLRRMKQSPQQAASCSNTRAKAALVLTWNARLAMKRSNRLTARSRVESFSWCSCATCKKKKEDQVRLHACAGSRCPRQVAAATAVDGPALIAGRQSVQGAGTLHR